MIQLRSLGTAVVLEGTAASAVLCMAGHQSHNHNHKATERIQIRGRMIGNLDTLATLNAARELQGSPTPSKGSDSEPMR